MSNLRNDDSPPPLWGLVLAGGESRRMGLDKGRLAYGGEAQATRAWRMLDSVCARAFVSVRPGQADAEPYAQLPYIVDADRSAKGPAAGLLAAWARYDGIAWLVLATDMPFVDDSMLRELMDERDPGAIATAFRGRDGKPEPLCAIWEPHAHDALLSRARNGNRSLRGLLEESRICSVEPSDASKLASVNTPEDHARISAALGGGSVPQGR